jgi:hypothetical protein
MSAVPTHTRTWPGGGASARRALGRLHHSATNTTITSAPRNRKTKTCSRAAAVIDASAAAAAPARQQQQQEHAEVEELQREFHAWCVDSGIESPDLAIGYVGGGGPDEARPFFFFHQFTFAAHLKQCDAASTYEYSYSLACRYRIARTAQSSDMTVDRQTGDWTLE